MQEATTTFSPWAHPFVDVFAGLLAFSNAAAQRSTCRIATLGPAGTSSEYAAHSFLEKFVHGAGQCNLYRSYEEAAGSVQDGSNDLLLVANAYSRINEFYISDTLRLASFFVLNTRPYGFAMRPDASTLQTNREMTVATHPAPAHLLTWFTGQLSVNATPRLVRSTSEAAILVACGDVEACLTNEDARQRCGLVFLGRTRPIQMLWSVFARADDETIPGFPQCHTR